VASKIGKALAFVGFFSYPIYLWHVDMARLPLQALARAGFLQWLPPSYRWVAFSIIYVAVATFGGVLLGLLIEKPALAIRDRFFPSRTRIPVAHEISSDWTNADREGKHLAEVSS
jgi:peptidoglycan/LPS O-acetylase OafA/YrhL